MANKILIVDNSAALRASVDYSLSEVGYEVLHATNGKEALDLLTSYSGKHDEIGMIITDINMPLMDGISFIKKVKETPFKFVPILVMTAESEESKKLEGKEAGASGWLVKPFNPEQLLKIVSKFVRS